MITSQNYLEQKTLQIAGRGDTKINFYTDGWAFSICEELSFNSNRTDENDTFM